MAVIITVNSLEKNIGVSNVVLTLGEKLSYITNKSTCIVELDYENPSFSYTLEREPIGSLNIDNIIPFLQDKAVADDDVIDVVKFNAKTFRNSNVSIIYGRKSAVKFNSQQLNMLINTLRQMYEIIVVDYGEKILPDILMDNTDLNLLVVQGTSRYIEKLKLNRADYIGKKTQLVLNNCAKGLTDVSFLLKEKVKDVDVIGNLPSSNTLVTNILKGIINMDKGDYANKLSKISAKICKYLSIESKSKSSVMDKLFNKTDSRVNDVYIEPFKSTLLGQILIEEKVCTQEDIDKCLKIQAKRLG